MPSDLYLVSVTHLTFRGLKIVLDSFVTQYGKKIQLSLKYLCSYLDNYFLNYHSIIFLLKSFFGITSIFLVSSHFLFWRFSSLKKLLPLTSDQQYNNAAYASKTYRDGKEGKVFNSFLLHITTRLFSFQSLEECSFKTVFDSLPLGLFLFWRTKAVG